MVSDRKKQFPWIFPIFPDFRPKNDIPMDFPMGFSDFRTSPVDFLVEFPSLPSCTAHPTGSANQTPPPAPAGRAETKRWRSRGARAKSRGWAAPCEIGEWMSPLNNGAHAKYVCNTIYIYIYITK